MRLTWQLLVVAVLVIFLGVVLALQHQANAELRDMIGLLHGQNQAVDRLQAERSRLVKAQVSAAELENLRADHAAIARLRGEIEAAKARLMEIEPADSNSAPHR